MTGPEEGLGVGPRIVTVLGDLEAWRDLYAAAEPEERAAAASLAERLLDAVDEQAERMLALPFTGRKALLDENVWVLAQGADRLQYAGGDAGEDAFPALAQIVAALALQPGGITFAGHHWCALHRLCASATQITVKGRP